MEKIPNDEVIIAELKEIIDRLMLSDYKTYEDRVFDKVATLKKNYGDKEVYKYRLFHVLFGSSNPSGIEHFDFPGEDSIETFIRSL